MTKAYRCMTRVLCIILLALLMVSPVLGFIEVNAETSAPNLTDDMKLMGYGYNVTAGVPLEGATSLNLASPILDMTDPALLAAINTFEIGSHTKANSTSSSSAREMATAVGSVIGGGLNIGISMVSADINFMFQRNTYSEKTVQEYYEYYYEEIIRRAIIIQMPVSEIKEHLSEAFLRDLRAVDSPLEAEALIQKYGTHLMTGYNLGGRLSFTNYRQSTSASEELQTQIDLKAKIGASVKTIEGGVDFSFGEQFTNREFTETATSEYGFQSIGGEAITALTIDHVFQYNPSIMDGNGGFVYNGWVQSVNKGTRLAILGLANGATAIPIWDLIPNDGTCEIARKFVMDAYIDVCGDKYSEYCEKYPYLKSNLDSSNGTNTSAEVKGYYYSVNNNYYYVDSDGMKIHNTKVAPGATLYLDVFHSIPANKINYRLTEKSKSYATVLDSINGIIKINSNAGVGRTVTVEICDGDEAREFLSVTVSAPRYSGGIGTEKCPYLISNGKDFMDISNHTEDWNSYFRLTNNIDVGSKESFGGIGNKTVYFGGVFDGNYCYIANFRMFIPKDNAMGVFPYSNGTIKNLTIGAEEFTTAIKSDSDKGGNFVGGLVGYMDGGTVENCKVRNITVESRFTSGAPADYTASSGGLIGEIQKGTVTECASINATVVAYVKNSDQEKSKGHALVGGLIGNVAGGTVSECWVHSLVRMQAQVNSKTEAKAYQGALSGKISGSAVVKNCVTGLYENAESNQKPLAETNGDKETYFGAFIGYMDGTAATFENCYCQTNTEQKYDIYTGASTEAKKITKIGHAIKFSDVSLNDKWQAQDEDQFPALKRHLSGYVSIKVENADVTSYVDSYWNPMNISVSRVENGTATAKVAFKVDAALTQPFDRINTKTYDIVAAGCSEAHKINVVYKEILGIYAEDMSTDKNYGSEVFGVIYCDEKFTADTHASDIGIYAVLSNGQKHLLAIGDKLQPRDLNIKYPELSIDYTLETQNVGKNRVIVSLNKNLICQYTIECRERKVEDVTVELAIPEGYEGDPKDYVPKYTVGSVFDSKSIKKIWVKYEGIDEPVEVTVADVEFVGDTVYYGESQVHLAYKDYTSFAINVNGVCNASTHIGGIKNCQDMAVCERCGAEYEAYGAHDYVKTVVLPTCTEAGYDEYKCTVCKDSYKDNYVSAVGHEGGVATCQKPAQCVHCKEEYGSLGGHIYTETVFAPTCESDGYTVHTCTECDDTYRSDVVLATGHKGGIATCIARAICTICEATYGGYATHDYSSLVTPPTCTAAGYTEYKCATCEHTYRDNYVSALGHSGGAADCENQATCEVCGSPYGEMGSHKYTSVKTEPTCVKDGSIKSTCSVCGDVETEILNALGHTGGTATCKVKAKCTRCGAEYGTFSEHTYTSKTVNPTCVRDGYVLHTCSVCADSYTSDGVSAKGHSGGTATCKSQAVCTVCSQKYGPLGEHNYTTSITSANCTSVGYTTHRCVTCGDNYKDSYVSALGHIGGKATCLDVAVCERCGEEYGEFGDHIYTPKTVPPTCESAGYTQYDCFACGNASYVANIVPATGHIGGKATCNTLAVCTLCKEPYGEYAGHKYTSKVVAPTCTENGYTEYTCSVCETGYKDTYTEACGHKGGTADCTNSAICDKCGVSYGAKGEHKYTVTVIAPTCTENGYTEYTCTVCETGYKDTYTEAYGHKGGTADCTNPAICDKCGEFYGAKGEHKYTSKVVAPTCTEDGYTEYTCTVCEKGYKDTYTEAYGHKGGTADCTNPAICDKCGVSYGAKGDHKYTSKVVAPTCTEMGYTEYTCTVCEETYSADHKAALGHNYIAEVTPPTATEQGYTTNTCSMCGDSTKTDYVEALGDSSGNDIGNDENNTVAEPVCEHTGGTATCNELAECDKCGVAYGEFAHDYIEGGCKDGKCKNCDAVKPKGKESSAISSFATLMLNILIVPLGFIFKRRFF